MYRGPRKITLADRLRYRFDNTISKGTSALIAWLALILLALILTNTLFVYLTGIAPAPHGTRPGFFQTLWLGLMHTIYPANIGGDTGSWSYLLIMLTVTAGGILIPQRSLATGERRAPSSVIPPEAGIHGS